MARAKTTGDLLQQSRRRYERAAKGWEKQAAKAEGFEKKALMTLSRMAKKAAEQSYAKKITAGLDKKADKEAAIRKHLSMEVSREYKVTKGLANLGRDTRREVIGKTYAAGTGAKTFYAATKDWWKGKSYAERDDAIIRKLNQLVQDKNKSVAAHNRQFPKAKWSFYGPVKNILDAMERFEELTGIDPLTPDYDASNASDIEKYDTSSQRARRKLR